MLREHAFDRTTGRRLLALQIASPHDLLPIELPKRHFACLLAWDASHDSADMVATFVGRLLSGGASYIVCWGPGCERVHDIVDELASHPDDNFGIPDDACVMTTWHDSEPLEEALCFFLTNSQPDAHYEGSTRVGLAISVGSSEWAKKIAAALDHPQEFIEHACRAAP